MNRIIIPAGYMGSGSSAITDLVSEFKDCKNDFKSYEYILMHCPNGVFDLEDKLLNGNNAIRSDEAIRSFEKQMKKLYDKKFWWVGNYKKIIGPNFMNITNEYIQSLTNLNYPGYWYFHEEVNFPMFLKLLLRKPLKLITLNKIKFKKILKYNDGIRICIPTKEEFYSKSKKYVSDIINEVAQDSDNIILDQFLLPFNLFRIDNYFDENARCIVVERDPRDVFILNKYIWGKKQISVPMPLDVNEFCEYYRRMRESEKPCNSNKVLRVKFEDLIYKYDETLLRIMNHLDFTPEMHINKKSRFDPNKSINNTQLFNNPLYSDEIKIIENKLTAYLYDFPYLVENEVKNTVEFD